MTRNDYQPTTADKWYQTMGRDGNPLGRLRHDRIGGGFVAELHDETAISDGARIDVFKWTHHTDEADIPRTYEEEGHEWPGGWIRVASQMWETYADAITMWDAYDNAELVEVLADE